MGPHKVQLRMATNVTHKGLIYCCSEQIFHIQYHGHSSYLPLPNRLIDIRSYTIFPVASLSHDMATYAVTIYSLSQFSQHGCILDIPSSLEVHHSQHHQIPWSVEKKLLKCLLSTVLSLLNNNGHYFPFLKLNIMYVPLYASYFHFSVLLTTFHFKSTTIKLNSRLYHFF